MDRLVLLATLAFLSGCSAAGPNGSLEASANPPNVHLENRTGGTIHYVAIEANLVPLIDLAPVEAWPTLEDGETLSVPYHSLTGYDESDSRAVVFWSDGQSFKQIGVEL